MSKIVIKVLDDYTVGTDGSISDGFFIVRKDLVEKVVRVTKKDRIPKWRMDTLSSLARKGYHTLRTDEIRIIDREEFRVYRGPGRELLVQKVYDDALTPLAWSAKAVDVGMQRYLLYYDCEGNVMAAVGYRVIDIDQEGEQS